MVLPHAYAIVHCLLFSHQVVEDAEVPEAASTFQRRPGKARRYWGKVNRGIKNFRRRRRARQRLPQAVADDTAKGVRAHVHQSA